MSTDTHQEGDALRKADCLSLTMASEQTTAAFAVDFLKRQHDYHTSSELAFVQLCRAEITYGEFSSLRCIFMMSDHI